MDFPTRETTALLVIDMQERLLNAFPEDRRAAVIKNGRILVETARVFDLPIVVSEQYPKGLGPTTAEIREPVGESFAPIEKMVFSCGRSPEFRAALERTGRRDLILCGVETHVCVLQTALDLMHAEYRVYVPADAVTSRRELDWEKGVDLMAAGGALVGTTETFVFQLLERAGTDEFKRISKLLK